MDDFIKEIESNILYKKIIEEYERRIEYNAIGEVILNNIENEGKIY